MDFQMKIPRLVIPPIRIPKGLIHFWVGPWEISIPPSDITIFPGLELLKETVVFDSEWVWKYFMETLDKLAEDFYKAHSEEKK